LAKATKKNFFSSLPSLLYSSAVFSYKNVIKERKIFENFGEEEKKN
jgi:hypothetical protein